MERFQHGFELGYAACIDEEMNAARNPYRITIATCEAKHEITLDLSFSELEILETLASLNNALVVRCCSPEISIARVAVVEGGAA